MPKTPIDYSKAVIYKIEHNDNPELLYVGSTTDFIRRKYQHKSICNNENCNEYNRKLYRMIRENGNWESFKIMIICEFPCNNKTELVIQEEKYRKELQTSLNTIRCYIGLKEHKEEQKEKAKVYRDNNNEKVKVYRDNNKEKAKVYYKEKSKQKITCDCGSIFRKYDKLRHEKTIKHCQFIQ